MELTKDAYLEIAKTADDKSVVKMLSVNRKFHDDEFFKLVFEHRYPLLIKFKKDKESWKDFYLRMVMYIAKLKEEYDLDYIPSPKFNPQKFYDFVNVVNEEENWQLEAAEYLADVKDLQFLKKFLLKYAKFLDFNHLISAEMLSKNDLNRIKLFVDSDIKFNSFRRFYSPVYTNPIYSAIDNENIELLKILILPNIRAHNLENFISYARQANKPLSEKYLVSQVK